MASVAVVLAAAMAGFGFLCCSNELPMEAQLNEPVTVGKRKRFSYVGMKEETKGMARLNSKASIEASMSAGFMGAGDDDGGGGMNSGFDFGRGPSVRSANTDGYIDVGSDGQTFHIPLDTAKTVVVGADGNIPSSSPTKQFARRQSATQAFGAFAALAQQQHDGAATAAAVPYESVQSSELEQARLEGEVRALGRLAAATRAPAEARLGTTAATMSSAAAAADSAEMLQRTRAEIDRLRSELGLATATGMRPDAPAWQPGRVWN